MTASVQARHRRIGEVLFALALVVYCVGIHLLVVEGRWPRITVAVVLGPWAIALASLALNKLSRRVAVVAIVGIAVATGWITNAVSGYPERTVLFESVAFNLALAGVFAGSLVRRGDALITGVARMVRGDDMPPRVVAYTRTITGVWSAFFVVYALTSTLLYLTASRDAWSVFANLLYWPLIVAMFVGEYAIRRMVLRDVHHVSLMSSVRAYAQAQDHKGAR